MRRNNDKKLFLEYMDSVSSELASKNTLMAKIFLLFWPGFNLVITTLTLISLGEASLTTILHAGAKLWFVFAIAYVIVINLRLIGLDEFAKKGLINQILVHVIIFIMIFSVFSPIVELPESDNFPKVMVVPFFFLILQIVVYVAVMHIFQQQRNAFEANLIIKDAELNVLRAQGNPHFLFNTLNLIATELPEAPEKAQELIYDLADLLRSSIDLSNQKFTSIAEELNWVRLFLTIQQKRFQDRLSFCIDVDKETEMLRLPALILQPIIENTVKHAVAPYTKKAHITVKTTLDGNKLNIEVLDTGPVQKNMLLKEGEGFRIIKKTLNLHYSNDHSFSFNSSADGGKTSITIPAVENRLEHQEV